MAKNETTQEVDQQTVESLKEVPFEISFKGMYKMWTRIFYDFPTKAYSKVTSKVDAATRPMMTGPLAVATLPLGIMVRNGARAAHEGVKGDYQGLAHFVGGVAAAGTWGLAGYAAYGGIMGLAGLSGTIGAIGAAIGAAVVTAPILTPAFAVGTMGAATLGAGAVFAVSTLGAVANLRTGWRRSVASFKGIKVDAKQLEVEFDKNSVRTRLQEEARRTVYNNLYSLSEDSKKQLVADLQQEFEVAAERKAETVKTPEVKPEPVAAKTTPAAGPNPS